MGTRPRDRGLQSRILDLLVSVENGAVSATAASEQLGPLPYDDLGFARVDTQRELRQGAPEAVLAEGKEPHEIEAIVSALVDGDAGSVLVTRADAEARAAVRAGTLATSAPLIPIHVGGSAMIMPKGRDVIQRGRTTVAFGRPIYPCDDEGPRELIDRVQTAIGALGKRR